MTCVIEGFVEGVTLIGGIMAKLGDPNITAASELLKNTKVMSQRMPGERKDFFTEDDRVWSLKQLLEVQRENNRLKKRLFRKTSNDCDN